jgi:hypothetical protein
MAEPEKFHVGMIDFFSVILPGAVLTYVLQALDILKRLGMPFPPPPTPEAGWAVFLVTSYVAGHFVFLVGSWIDELYDAYVNWQRASLSPHRRKTLKWRMPARCWARLRKQKKFAPLNSALLIKAEMAWKAGVSVDAMNAFQWAKCRLALEAPLALARVERFEADSKFFRSFAVVTIVLVVPLSLAGLWGCSLVSFAATVLALLRYGDQRFKATRQAYMYILILKMAPKGANDCAANLG